MIDSSKLKELVQLMVENDIAELDLRDDKTTVAIKRSSGQVMMMPAVAPAMQMAPAPAGGVPSAPPGDSGLVAIESPMVGSFYASPNPDSPPYVNAGAKIGAGTVVCLIEAMKVFNEIKSEVSGTVERMLVKSGDAVEFGQKLFLVRPN